MKVMHMLILALALAAPLTLVSADELVIKVNTDRLGDNGVKYSGDIKEFLIPTSMDYEDVVVVPPRLDNTVIVSVEANKLSDVPEVAYIEVMNQ